MPSIVDTFPYPWQRTDAQELHLALTAIYPNERGAQFVAAKVGIELYELTPNQPPLYLWREILDLAANRSITRTLVMLVRAQNAMHPRAAFLDLILVDGSIVLDGQKRDADGSAIFLDGSDRISVPEALLYCHDLTMHTGRLGELIETLQLMRDIAPSVCLLRVSTSTFSSSGTAFRIGSDLLLTNHHVLFPRDNAAITVIAEFGFETDVNDLGLASTSLPCDLASIASDPVDDWGVIRTKDQMAPDGPIVDLDAAVIPYIGQSTYILQHPLGGRKRLGFVRNTVTDFDDRLVHYLTDTQEGSSGSPVFDRRGRIIALHHAGGAPQEVAGKPPLRKNEGIVIGRILQVLRAKGILPKKI